MLSKNSRNILSVIKGVLTMAMPTQPVRAIERFFDKAPMQSEHLPGSHSAYVNTHQAKPIFRTCASCCSITPAEDSHAHSLTQLHTRLSMHRQNHVCFMVCHSRAPCDSVIPCSVYAAVCMRAIYIKSSPFFSFSVCVRFYIPISL